MSRRPRPAAGLRIGIDVGGTFTDGIAIAADGRTWTAKVPSTPDPSEGFFAALDALLQAAGARWGPATEPAGGRPRRRTGAGAPEVGFVAHGTTAATNALIEGRGARSAFVTNRGFRDMLEIAFQSRPDLYDLRARRAPPLVPRERCFEVGGRLDAQGNEVEPLDEAELAALADRLAALDPPLEAVVVCLLHAYRNDAHERRVAAVLAQRLGPGVVVVPSAEVCREFREYPRASTAAVNAAVAPLMDRYLGRVEAGLAARSIRCGLHVMQSNGGLVASPAARRRPAFVVESGPAAAAVAAAHVAREAGLHRVLALDIGGTTAKVALVIDGEPALAPEFEVGPRAAAPSRLGRGGGYPLRTPCVDLVEIGAGGGSVAWVDPGGALRVGPRSAGAVPGPACYPRGGDEPTLTDANLVLGRLDPRRFLGGRMRLRPEAARRALDGLGRAMGRTGVEAAAGVLEVAVSAMAAALRLATVDKGHDPRDFTLVVLGGAGPLHACEIAAAAGVGSVLVPPRPGLGSALGLLVTDLKLESVVTWPALLDAADLAGAAARLESLLAELRADLARQGVADPARVSLRRFLDLRYLGQSFELRIPWDDPALEDARALASRFHAAHRRLYGFDVPDEPVELVALRATALGRIDRPPRAPLAAPRGPATPVGHGRLVADEPTRPVRAPAYDRAALGSGHLVAGPALIHDPDATTYLPPGWAAEVDAAGNLRLERR